jgi:hypothetical protein
MQRRDGTSVRCRRSKIHRHRAARAENSIISGCSARLGTRVATSRE